MFNKINSKIFIAFTLFVSLLVIFTFFSENTYAEKSNIKIVVGITPLKNFVNEIGGEKVDIINWSDDIKTFVANALQPAKLSHLEVNEDEHQIHIEAPEDQLSLAIGRKGQNARLAARLTGWRIDITKLEETGTMEFEDKIQKAARSLAEHIEGLDELTAQKLVSRGFLSTQGICEAEVSDLTAVEGIDEEKASAIIESARNSVATE